MKKKRKGYYSISVVAKMFSVHQQTIRMYEKEGLISPKRSQGNTRLFSEEDVERLEEVINLTHKMGVNLAGVEVILRLQKKIDRMQKEMNNLFEQMQGNLAEESEDFKKDAKKQAIRLVEIKKSNIADQENSDQSSSPEDGESNVFDNESFIDDDWEVEYDEK